VKGLSSLLAALKKGGLERKLMSFFPPNKKSEEHFRQVFEEKGLLDIYKLHMSQVRADYIHFTFW